LADNIDVLEERQILWRAQRRAEVGEDTALERLSVGGARDSSEVGIVLLCPFLARSTSVPGIYGTVLETTHRCIDFAVSRARTPLT